MNLYTFILDYLGGTYISQIESNDEISAMNVWIDQLDVDLIQGFSNKDKNKIIENKFDDELPTLLNGLVNTWHFLIKTKKGNGYVNFVKTSKNA
jgi:hypothetical protein